MLKKAMLVGLPFVLAACAGGGGNPAEIPNVYSFVSNDKGISGSYFSATYEQKHVRSRVASLACTSGRLASYGETAAENGQVKFTAACAGENKFERTAGFTLNDVRKAGHITASVDGKLVRIQL